MSWNKFNLLIYQKADDVYKVPIKSELTLDSQSLQELRLKSQYHVLILYSYSAKKGQSSSSPSVTQHQHYMTERGEGIHASAFVERNPKLWNVTNVLQSMSPKRQ